MPLVECEPDPGVKVKEGMRPTSMALAVGAMVALAFGGCSQKFGELIYDDSLLCGDLNQACAPDGGRFDLHIVDRTSYVVATPSVPTFDMVIKPNSTVDAAAQRKKNSAVGAITLPIAGFCSSGILGIDGIWTKLK